MPPRFLAVGEVLLDVFSDRQVLGGAPANFACMAHQLGAESEVVSRVGKDDKGASVFRKLATRGLSTAGITVDPALPTGVVDVTLSAGQPSYTIRTGVAWDHIVADETALRLAKACDVVCFGTLAQRVEPSRSAIRQIIAATPDDALRILDVNLRPPFVSKDVIRDSLDLANVLKLNQDELTALAEMFGLRGRGMPGKLAELGAMFDLELLVLTRGEAGSALLANGDYHEHKGRKVELVDAVGAGDAFTAAAALGYLRAWPMKAINEVANEIAAYVCTQPGATPPIPPELRAAFEE